MKNIQSKNIISALEYCLHSFKNIKTELLTVDHPRRELAWGIGGLIVSLQANLLKITQDRIADSAKLEKPNAKDDIIFIKNQFNAFLDNMITLD